jgi:hypothetical protein
MYNVLRRGNSAVIQSDHDPDDLIVVEAVITSFAPVRGTSHCACGAPLKPWSLRNTAANTAELYCSRCHRVHGHIGLGTKVHR